MEKLVKQILGKNPQHIRWSWPQNWVLKLLSLLFAIFLWYFVVGEDKVDMTVHIPVEIVNLPRELVISNQFKKQLEVTVSGPRGLIRGITNQHVSRPVDLSKATPGTTLVRNDEESIPFPRGIRVLRIQPPYITLLLDRLIQKDLPIKALTSGKPMSGYEVVSITLEPPTLGLTGPQALLNEVTELPTTPIDIADLDTSVTRQVPLDLSPAISELIGETGVTARVNIAEKTVTKSISRVPLSITFAGPPLPATTTPAAITIKADIPLSLTKTGNNLRELFKATVATTELPPGEHSVPVRVETAKGIKLLEVSPATVTLTIGTAKPPQ